MFSVCNVIISVPQGSVVRPLLCMIYITDLSDVANNYQNTVTFKLFSDDAKFYSCIQNLKMWKLCKIVLTLCCSGQKSENLHFLFLNVKYLYSEMLNLVMCISLVAHPFLILIIILILVSLWITNLHLNCI